MPNPQRYPQWISNLLPRTPLLGLGEVLTSGHYKVVDIGDLCGRDGGISIEQTVPMKYVFQCGSWSVAASVPYVELSTVRQRAENLQEILTALRERRSHFEQFESQSQSLTVMLATVSRRASHAEQRQRELSLETERLKSEIEAKNDAIRRSDIAANDLRAVTRAIVVESEGIASSLREQLASQEHVANESSKRADDAERAVARTNDTINNLQWELTAKKKECETAAMSVKMARSEASASTQAAHEKIATLQKNLAHCQQRADDATEQAQRESREAELQKRYLQDAFRLAEDYGEAVKSLMRKTGTEPPRPRSRSARIRPTSSLGMALSNDLT